MHIEALGAEASYGEAIANPRVARSPAAARRRARQPRGAGDFRARTRLGRLELRAGNDRHLQRPAKADAGGAAVHVLHRQDGTRRPAVTIGDGAAAPVAVPAGARLRRAAVPARPSTKRAYPTGRRSKCPWPARLCPLRRQRQFVEYRDHRARAALSSARSDEKSHRSASSAISARWWRAPPSASRRPGLHALNFLVSERAGRRRHGVAAHRSAGQGLRADDAGNERRYPKILADAKLEGLSAISSMAQTEACRLCAAPSSEPAIQPTANRRRPHSRSDKRELASTQVACS